MFVELYLQNLNNLLFLMLTGPLQGSAGAAVGRKTPCGGYQGMGVIWERRLENNTRPVDIPRNDAN